MKGGLATYAYQALCSAEFIKKVGEQKYNGAGWRSVKYVQKIDRRINDIDRVQISSLISASQGV